MSKWPIIKIAELVDQNEADLQTGPFGTQLKASDYVETGIPVINVRNIGFGKIREEKLEYLGEKMADKLSVHKLVKDDIVFGRKGAVDRHALIDSKSEGWIQGSDCLRLRLKTNRVSNRYLSFYFCTSGHKYWMEAVCSFGATMSSLNQGIVKRINVPLPPIKIQDKIAAILSAYDDLIENNKRRIVLLEKMAEEIYREWFVRMRFPGHEKATFVKGVPSAWRVAELRELAKVNSSSIGRINKPDTIHYIDIRSVTTNRINGIRTLPFNEAPGRAKRIVKHGDIIWSSVRPGNRAYCLIYNPPKNLIVSTGFAVISPLENTPFTFLNFALTSDVFVDQMTTVAKGAAYPATSFDDFEKAKLLVPDEDLLTEFHRICEPFFHKKHLLSRQNEALSNLRDLLLPRLISGKLSVEDLDIQFPPSMQNEAAPAAEAKQGELFHA